jgi:hypothetical protein
MIYRCWTTLFASGNPMISGVNNSNLWFTIYLVELILEVVSRVA